MSEQGEEREAVAAAAAAAGAGAGAALHHHYRRYSREERRLTGSLRPSSHIHAHALSQVTERRTLEVGRLPPPSLSAMSASR